ncbi:uncharacterized protein LOC135837281 [Planococcus citri]|uniref:uncharacterized protein LOC135837281 n=1 Tax=Planococcus citri TaxID=170843 RepID=UPI0031F7D93B
MNLIKCICLILLFVCAENAPTSTTTSTISPSTTSSYEEHDVTEAINGQFSVIFKEIEKNNLLTVDQQNNVPVPANAQKNDGLLQNIAIELRIVQSSSLVTRIIHGDDLKMEWKNMLVSVNGSLRQFNDSIATEPFLLSLIVSLPKLSNKASVDYPYLDQQNITLRPNGHQYEPSAENQIKTELKWALKATFSESAPDSQVADIKAYYLEKPGFGSFSQHVQKHYYFINTIPSTDYTLSNVTIRGLWNIETITAQRLNPAYFFNIQMSGVEGTLVQNFAMKNLKPIKLSFNADHISVLSDDKADKIYFKFEEYSVTETESNKTLTNDQSKLIVERIESVITTSLRASAKNTALRAKYEKIYGLVPRE